jgi:hypothetical protein
MNITKKMTRVKEARKNGGRRDKKVDIGHNFDMILMKCPQVLNSVRIDRADMKKSIDEVRKFAMAKGEYVVSRMNLSLGGAF